MKQVFTFILCLWTVSLLYGQKRAVKFDFMTGIHKPTGSLNFENKLGWRVGCGLRYSFKDKSSLNILQVNYDKFTTAIRPVADAPDQEENGTGSNTLTLLTGYSYPILNRTYIGGNVGVGFVGHNKVDRIPKFGVNPFISFEPFREVYVDFGYLNFWGGYRNTNYLNFNLRYSF
jgi:hypothetical protein